MKKKIFLISLSAVTILLMALPYSVAMRFSDGPNNFFVSYYSYFSFMPIGYGNWFPMLTVIFSVIVLILHFKNNKRIVWVCQSICIITSSIGVLVWTSNNITVLGTAVTILHVVGLIFQIIFYKF